MTVAFLVGAAVGAVVLAAVLRLRSVRVPAAPVDDTGEDEVAEVETPDDRAARAEAIQAWLLAALDEVDDSVVVVDRLGR